MKEGCLVLIIIGILTAMFVFLLIEINQQKQAKPLTSNTGTKYSIVVIDGCEYIHGSHRLAHKGNCKNH